MLQTTIQLGLDPKTGKLVPGGVIPETQRALQNVEAVFSAAWSEGLKTTATQCLLMANSEDLLVQAARVYGQYVEDWDVLPALVLLVAEVPPFYNSTIAVQCYGSKD
jgi:enamine deaminase RidA (YjgF/YER057c/UK114 family)